MQSGGGIQVDKTSAGPGEQIEIQVTNGASEVEIVVFGGPDTTETKPVPAGGKVVITVPSSAGAGTFIIVSAGSPPASKTIEVVTTGG
jgi:hypothetical protein